MLDGAGFPIPIQEELARTGRRSEDGGELLQSVKEPIRVGARLVRRLLLIHAGRTSRAR
jgi:hypothetical protein